MTDLESSNNLIERYQAVHRDVTTLAKQFEHSVSLLAVSKKHSIKSIETVYRQGQKSFGENYVQEGVDKVTALSELDIDWHFIGPIQSNKTRLVAEHFHWVHTVDREKTAQRLNDQRPSELPALNVLIQINISEQDSKSGISLSELPTLSQFVASQPHLKLRGLMCIPAPSDAEKLRDDFNRMAEAFNRLKSQYSSVDTLSMGMSGDLDLAIESGSNLVRIGTAIFGERH